jgi:hypothetical protein
MTLATVQLSEALEAMIDSRLDTIDRILMGRVPRHDRLMIVREVESQIHELLHESGGDEPTRDDVLAVLARLDPPEAYLPDASEGGPVSVHKGMPTRAARPSLKDDARVGWWSGMLGLGANALLFILVPLTYLIAIGFHSEAPLVIVGGPTVLLVFVAALLGLVLGILTRKSGVWAIVGIVMSLLAPVLAFAIFAAMFFLG